MKSTEIHEGLENKEIRDFLSMTFVKSFEESTKSKMKDIDGNLKGIDLRIAVVERDLAAINNELTGLKEMKAVQIIVEKQGWQEFDVSDETFNDTGYKMWMNFIGTQKEYDKLIDKINNEKN